MDLINIRPATPDDAEDIARIHIAAWRQAYLGLMPDDILGRLDVRTRADAWRGILEQTDQPCLLAQVDGRTAGFISLCGSRDPDRDGLIVGEISAIYLHPACWRRGIGSRLVASAMDILARRGYSAVDLWVLEGNHAARAFYDRLGFEPDGIHKPEPRSGLLELRYTARPDRGRLEP